MAVLLEFQWAEARSVARWIVVLRTARRNDATLLPSRVALVGSGVAAQGVVGELEVIALAHEHPQRAVALARRGGDYGDAPAQQGDGRVELAVVVLLRDRRSHVLRRDAERAEAPRDPLGAPGVEPTAVLGEPPGKAGVVDVAALEQLPHHHARILGGDPLAC